MICFDFSKIKIIFGPYFLWYLNQDLFPQFLDTKVCLIDMKYSFNGKIFIYCREEEIPHTTSYREIFCSSNYKDVTCYECQLGHGLRLLEEA